MRDRLSVPSELELDLRPCRAGTGVQAEEERDGRGPLRKRAAEERSRAQRARPERVFRCGRGRAHVVRAHDRDAAQPQGRGRHGNLERGAPRGDAPALPILDRRLEDVAPRREAQRPLDHRRALPRDLDLGERPLDRRVVAEARDERALLVLDLTEQAHAAAVGGLVRGEAQPCVRDLDPDERLRLRPAARKAQRGGAVFDLARHRRGREGLGEGQLVGQHHRRARRHRVVAAPRADDDARARDLHRDRAPAAVGFRVGRDVADLVVGAQVGHHALEPGPEVVRLGHEEPARALRQVPQDALPVEAERVLRHLRGVDPHRGHGLVGHGTADLVGEGRLAGQAERQLRLFRGRADAQPPRVESIDRDVRPVGRAHGRLEELLDPRWDGEALGEVEEGLAALDERQGARDREERLERGLALALSHDGIGEEEHPRLHRHEPRVELVGLRGGLRVTGQGEGLLRGVVVARTARGVAGLVDSLRRLLDRRGEALPVLRERLQDAKALPHLEDGEHRSPREGPIRQLESRRARVLRPLRAELVEDEGDDTDQAVLDIRRPARFAGRLHRRRGGRPRARLGRTRRLLAFRLHEAERLNGAGFAVLEDLHLVRPQVLHEPAGLVADDEIEQDEVGPCGKDRRRGRVLRPREGRGRQEDESHARQGQFHRFNPSRCGSSIACRRNSQARFVPRGCRRRDCGSFGARPTRSPSG